MAYTQDVNGDIVISGWEEGILDDPYKGIYDMRNVDPLSIPGEVSIAMKTQTMNTQGAISSVTITADPATDTITYDGVVPLEIGTVVYFVNTGGELPTGITSYSAYYVKTIPTPTTFTISTTYGGTTLDITGAGSGTNRFTVVLPYIPKYFTSALIDAHHNAYFMSDSKGRCWLYSDPYFGNTGKWIYMNNRGSENPSFDSACEVNGLISYKEYLFVFQPTGIDAIYLNNFYYGVLKWATNVDAWVRSWQDCGSSSNISSESRQAIVAPNDFVYFCNQHYVGAFEETDGQTFNLAKTHTNTTGAATDGSTTITTTTSFFDTSDVGAIITDDGGTLGTGRLIINVINSKTATISDAARGTDTGLKFTITSGCTYTPEALYVSSTDFVNCLENYPGGMLIGGSLNRIYFWDLLSNGWNNIIYLSENFVKRIVTLNNTAYVFAGYKGRIFVTNGGNATPYWKVPEYLSGTVNPYITWQDAIFKRNQLYFSFSLKTNANTTINECAGVWAVNIDSNTPTNPRLQLQMSYATYTGYASALYSYMMDTQLTSPSSDGYGLFIGWYDGTKSGIDKTISTPYTNGEPYVTSDLIPVGQFKTKKTFQNLEYKLGAPLVSGESISLYYRLDLNSAFVNVPITSGGGVGDVSGLCDTVTFENAQWIQVKAVLNGTATSPSYVRLRELRIR